MKSQTQYIDPLLDNWKTNWETSYLSATTDTPNKLRVAGETPQTNRLFNVTSGLEYELSYTQSENNSVSFSIEESDNGTSWQNVVSNASSNGTQTVSFIPSASFLKVSFEASAGFKLQNVSLNGELFDTLVVAKMLGGTGYRYGYNTQERVDEISGKGNHYTAEFWEYSPRLGRRWNIDPVYKQHLSNYSVLSGNPIMKVDPNGDDDGEYKTPNGKVLGKDGVDDGLEHIISEENFRNTISYALSPEVNKRNLSDFVINTRSNISGTKASNLSVTGSSIAVNSGFDNSMTNLEDIVINTGTGLGTLSSLFGGNYGLTSNQNFRYGEGESQHYRYLRHILFSL